MNKNQVQRRRNDAIRFLDAQSRINLNACNFNSGCTDAHEDLKWRLFKEFRRAGMDVVTEAKFKNGEGRCDLLVLDSMDIYEVVESENDASLQEKASRYPEPFGIWAVRWQQQEITGKYVVEKVR